MKTVVVANQKGGVGKTTFSVHLAHYAVEQEARVLVVDLDPQSNSSSTLSQYASGIVASQLFKTAPIELPAGARAVLIEADPALVDIDRAPASVLENFVKHLEAFAKDFDVCVIDTAPSAGLRQVAALVVANHVVSPIELETYSIDGIRTMLQTIFGVRNKYNPKMQFLGMLPSRFNSHSPAQKAALAALLKEHPKLVLPIAIGLRTSVAEAITEKVPVWRLQKTSAREAGREMRAALAAVVEQMGGLT